MAQAKTLSDEEIRELFNDVDSGDSDFRYGFVTSLQGNMNRSVAGNLKFLHRIHKFGLLNKCVICGYKHRRIYFFARKHKKRKANTI